MEVRDVFGHVIHEYDVCKAMATGEVMLVIKGSDGKLIVRNNIIGLSDYLDVYPDGELVRDVVSSCILFILQKGRLCDAIDRTDQ